ncbi:bacteriocin immunity protein [Streptococcus halitosis]|uniref:bacteriocin immunity protein n=1 Tax=Streptococcus halitosis TaxID=2172545 RepID=UPI002005EBFF|nr:bacteriocin immunity protein [Streptococcus halitosis]MCK6128998.1 bacteriocin immunity protein [Streptococcus halitosis]MCK6216001.1 bacteriocin immunity protein [Streptococcus halitosis]
MTPLKWFAGGSERRCKAMTIIDHLLEDIKAAPQLAPLKNQLVIYKKRLKDDGTSTPFILSQMNVDISRVLIDNKLSLSESQAKQVKKLRELSAIRYGY